MTHRADREEPTHETLDLSASPSVLLVFAANRFTRIWTRVLQDLYGIGAMEWRLMVMLAAEPEATVSRASAVIDIDKAAISRAFGRLEAKGLAKADVPDAYRLRRQWRLTKKGLSLHDEILVIALQRQDEMLAGVSDKDQAQLVAALQRILDNLARLEDEDSKPDPS